MIRALVFDFDGLILETETPAHQSWAEIYREHGHELPMDRWYDYIGSDTGFDPVGHLAALVGEGFDASATKARRDLRKTELIAALDVMAGVRDYIAEAKRLRLRLAVASSSSRAWVLGHLERLELHPQWDVIRTREDVARSVLARFPAVSETRVRVVKPEPDGLNAGAEAVELVLRR